MTLVQILQYLRQFWLYKMVDHISKISKPDIFDIRCLNWNSAIIVFIEKWSMDRRQYNSYVYQSINANWILDIFPLYIFQSTIISKNFRWNFIEWFKEIGYFIQISHDTSSFVDPVKEWTFGQHVHFFHA